ncbi:hypothetical protein GEMRC1_013076 [Eukaryota sp. GEM-RC1]
MDCFSKLQSCDVDQVPTHTKSAVDHFLHNKSLLTSSEGLSPLLQVIHNSSSSISLRGIDVLFRILHSLSVDHVDLISVLLQESNIIPEISNLLDSSDVLSKLALLELFADVLDNRHISLCFLHLPSFKELLTKIQVLGTESVSSSDYQDVFLFNSIIFFISHLCHLPKELLKPFLTLIRKAQSKAEDTLLVSLNAIGKLLSVENSRTILLEEKPASASLAVSLITHSLTPSSRPVSAPTSLTAKHAIATALMSEAQHPGPISIVTAFEHASRRINLPYPNAAYEQCMRAKGDDDASLASIRLVEGLCGLKTGLQGLTRVAGFIEWLTSSEPHLASDVAHAKLQLLKRVNDVETELRKSGQGLLSDATLVKIREKLMRGPFGGAGEYVVEVGEHVSE